jgi:hypothetical protein
MHDTKERLSLLWIFALLNYLYADVVALFAIVDSANLAYCIPVCQSPVPNCRVGILPQVWAQ